MLRFLFCIPFAFALAVALSPARAELPSLMPDQSARQTSLGEQRASLPSILAGLDAWRQGRLFGALEYRFGGSGLKASFSYAGAFTRALIGYGGEQRLELAWPAHGGSVNLAYVDAGGASGYRIEFVRNF